MTLYHFHDLLTPDLSEWKMAGGGGFKWVDEQTIESHGGSGLFWYAGQIYENFILRVEWRVRRRDDNSGVLVRCPALADDPGPAIERGYEIQIDERGYDPEAKREGSALHVTGAIYKVQPATALASRVIGEWNEFEIFARGSVMEVSLNNTQVCRLATASREPRGHIALQAHHDGSHVQFRNLRVRRLDD